MYACRSFLLSAILAGLIAATLPAAAARGDGGAVVAHDTAGPFAITLFVASQPVRAGTVDVSVLLEDRDTGAAILDAQVMLHLSPPEIVASETPATIALTHEQATNKLLYAASVELPAPGTWRLGLDARQGTRGTDLHTLLAVAPAAPALRAIWPYLLVPPLAVAVFAVHQWLSGGRAGA